MTCDNNEKNAIRTRSKSNEAKLAKSNEAKLAKSNEAKLTKSNEAKLAERQLRTKKTNNKNEHGNGKKKIARK